MKVYQTAEAIIGKITRAVAGFCLAVVFLLFLMNIATRLPFITWNPTWIDETIQFFLVWMVFLGAMELVRIGGHFMVDILTDKLHGSLPGRILRVFSTMITLAIYAVICFFGVQLCMRSTAAMFTLQFMKKSYFYACIPVSTFFMSLFALRDVVLAFVDLATRGAVTRRQDEEKAAAQLEDEDAQAIAEAAAALAEEPKKEKSE